MAKSGGRTPIFMHVLEGSYALGVDKFFSLKRFTREDQRWAAVCLYQLGRLTEAERMFQQLRDDGIRVAELHLASLHRGRGEETLAFACLERIQMAELLPFDRALCEYEFGRLYGHVGQPTLAIQCFQKALQQLALMSTEQRMFVQALVKLSLGTALMELGHHEEALGHFIVSSLGPNYEYTAHILIRRALCYVQLGQYQRGRSELQQCKKLFKLVPEIRGWFHYVLGVMAFMHGELLEAKKAFAETLHYTTNSSEQELVCLAELGLCAVITEHQQAFAARTHLERARPLVQTLGLKAWFRLREGALLLLEKREGGLKSLEEAAALFESIGACQGAVCAYLHLAEASLVLQPYTSDDGIVEALQRAVAARGESRNPGPFISELRMLSRLLNYLEELPTTSGPYTIFEDWQRFNKVYKVKLVTLGSSRLLINGENVNLRLTRAVDIIAFLLEHKNISRKRIFREMFGDSSKKSKSYFHQVRFMLNNTISGLKIAFNSKAKTYNIECADNVEITSDTEEFVDLLDSGKDGIVHAMAMYKEFLPNSDSYWVGIRRGELFNQLISAGIAVINELFDRNELNECIDLALKVLGMDPLRRDVYALLVRAMWRAYGPEAGQALVEQLRERFQDWRMPEETPREGKGLNAESEFLGSGWQHNAVAVPPKKN